MTTLGKKRGASVQAEGRVRLGALSGRGRKALDSELARSRQKKDMLCYREERDTSRGRGKKRNFFNLLPRITRERGRGNAFPREKGGRRILKRRERGGGRGATSLFSTKKKKAI